jgi:hypothetical protein
MIKLQITDPEICKQCKFLCCIKQSNKSCEEVESSLMLKLRGLKGARVF